MGKGARAAGAGNGNERQQKFPFPRLPAGVQARVCRFGMNCRRPDCSYIHLRAKTGRPLNSIGVEGGDLMADFDPSLLAFDGETNTYVLDDEGVDFSAEESKGVDGPKADPLGLLGNLSKSTEHRRMRLTRTRSEHSEGESDGTCSHAGCSHSSARSDKSDRFSDVRAALNTIKHEPIKPDFQFGKWPASGEQLGPCVDSVPQPKALFAGQADA